MKYMWIGYRKVITDLISVVVIKKVMISININKPAIFTTQIQRCYSPFESKFETGDD